MLDYVALSPIGAQLNDFGVDSLEPSTVEDVRRLLAERGVVVIPGQQIDDHAFLRFLHCFGTTMFTAGETPVAGFAELNVITNVGRTTPPRSTFHTDTSYVRKPPDYTALRAVSVPRRGGYTLFTDQYAAYETLPEQVRERLRGRTITHVVTGLELDADEETSATHQIFRVHPISGRTYLYLSAPARCVEVSGMSAQSAAATVNYLFAHSTRLTKVYRHSWSPGDVVMWDNRCVLHRADHRGVEGDRVMHRGMVAAGASEACE